MENCSIVSAATFLAAIYWPPTVFQAFYLLNKIYWGFWYRNVVHHIPQFMAYNETWAMQGPNCVLFSPIISNAHFYSPLWHRHPLCVLDVCPYICTHPCKISNGFLWVDFPLTWPVLCYKSHSFSHLFLLNTMSWRAITAAVCLFWVLPLTAVWYFIMYSHLIFLIHSPKDGHPDCLQLSSKQSTGTAQWRTSS